MYGIHRLGKSRRGIELAGCAAQAPESDYLGITSHKTAPVWVTIGQAYTATNEGSKVLSTPGKGTGEARQKHGRGTENEAKPRQEA